MSGGGRTSERGGGRASEKGGGRAIAGEEERVRGGGKS